MTWSDDDELFAMVREHLYTAVIGDILDTLGRLNQFLSPRIQPLRDDMFVVGRAMTVLEADCRSDGTEICNNALMAKPFGLMLEALDDLKRNEVYICTGGSPNYALWGELMSTRALHCGAVGAVVDGWSRDTNGILALDFPTFSYGRYAQDQAPRGKVIDFRCRLEMNGVTINDGDIIVGDIDGVVVVPRDCEVEVFQKSYEKATGEKMVQKAIAEGMTAREAFDRFGIM